MIEQGNLAPNTGHECKGGRVRFGGPIAGMKERRNGRASDFVCDVKAFCLIYLNDRVARQLFVFVELE
jgi:hypothetical protein